MEKRLRDLTELVYNSPEYAILQVKQDAEPLDLIKLGFRGNETLMRVSKDPETVLVNVFSDDAPPLRIARGSENTVDRELSGMARKILECVNLDYGIVTNSYAKNFQELVENTSGYRDLGYARRYSINVNGAGRYALAVNGQNLGSFKTMEEASEWVGSRGYQGIAMPDGADSNGTVEMGYLELSPEAKELGRDPYDCIRGAEQIVEDEHPPLTGRERDRINALLNERPDVRGYIVSVDAVESEQLDEEVKNAAYASRRESPEAFAKALEMAIDSYYEGQIGEKALELALDAADSGYDMNDALKHVRDIYAFEIPYDRHFDTEVDVDVLVAEPDERVRDFFAIADMKSELDGNAFSVDLLEHDNGLTWLVEQQGYPLVDLKTAYTLKESGRPYEGKLMGPFITQTAQELENFPLAAGTLAALAKVRVRDIPLLLDGKSSLTLPAGTTLGLLAAGEGASGGFGIVLEKRLEIPADKIVDVQVEGAVCDYCTAKEAEPGKALAWTRPVAIEAMSQSQASERLQGSETAERSKAMENDATKNEYRGATWTPWAQVLCPDHVGRENFPNLPSEEEWRQWTTPTALEEDNAVTFCDSCGDPVQLSRQVAEEHNLVYELRSMGFEASMGQTGGMNSACLVDIADAVKWDDEVESPDLMYICYDEFGDKTYYVEVHSEEGIVAETDWSEMSFPDKESLMTWVNDNSEKLAPLEPEEGKTVDELMKEAKEKLSVLHSEESKSLDDLIKEAKEKAAERTPDPDKPPRSATKQLPNVDR